MNINKHDTAVALIDPQNKVLHETGRAWPLVRESPREHNTIENLERLFTAAKAQGLWPEPGRNINVSLFQGTLS